eukprot:15565376-Heterocapsa_arctica.AAC.1
MTHPEQVYPPWMKGPSSTTRSRSPAAMYHHYTQPGNPSSSRTGMCLRTPPRPESKASGAFRPSRIFRP